MLWEHIWVWQEIESWTNVVVLNLVVWSEGPWCWQQNAIADSSPAISHSEGELTGGNLISQGWCEGNFSSSKKTLMCLARKCCASPFSSKNTLPASPLHDMDGQRNFPLKEARWKGLSSKFSLWTKPAIEPDLPVVSLLSASPSPPRSHLCIPPLTINKDHERQWGTSQIL